jgi:hypothetical protein
VVTPEALAFSGVTDQALVPTSPEGRFLKAIRGALREHRKRGVWSLS